MPTRELYKKDKKMKMNKGGKVKYMDGGKVKMKMNYGGKVKFEGGGQVFNKKFSGVY